MARKEKPFGVFKCPNCEKVFNDEDFQENGPVYECSDDGTTFIRDESADGGSNRCPECNKWGAKIAWGSCPECLSDTGEDPEGIWGDEALAYVRCEDCECLVFPDKSEEDGEEVLTCPEDADHTLEL